MNKYPVVATCVTPLVALLQTYIFPAPFVWVAGLLLADIGLVSWAWAGLWTVTGIAIWQKTYGIAYLLPKVPENNTMQLRHWLEWCREN